MIGFNTIQKNMNEKLLQLLLGGKLFKQCMAEKNELDDVIPEMFVSHRLKVVHVIKKLLIVIFMAYGGMLISGALSATTALMCKNIVNVTRDKQAMLVALLYIMIWALFTIMIVRLIIGWAIKDGVYPNITCYLKRERISWQKSIRVTKYSCLSMMVCGVVILFFLWFGKSIAEKNIIMTSLDQKLLQAITLIFGLMFSRIIADFFLYAYALDGIMGTVYVKSKQPSLEGFVQTQYIGKLMGVISAAIYAVYFWKLFFFHLTIAFLALVLYTKYRSIRQVLMVDFIYVVIIVLAMSIAGN